ncbi:hypothetical protein CKM354_000090300 [Cercospora kikuchii]|uniref:Rhodopsin domain-containing protein n=1 Tax=Cercospora kikuchii TaxID=84275 RepID=A0A9P3F879_9PEZI|nr:uncharacterized protein CKM354_000090300 [Cercospora kikuchii]GIZ37458.1 hypothetical protein CKM354_000090300 [Cercospora kikuchii]
MVAGSGHASGAAVVASCVTFNVLAALLTFARLYTRATITRTLGLDDHLAAFALLLAIFLTVCMVKQVHYGMGRHFDTLTPDDMVHSLKWFWASTWTYALGLGVIKTSILLQYLRFFTMRKWRIAALLVLAMNVVWTIWGFFASIFLCHPISDFWGPPQTANCMNRMAVWYSMAGGSIFTDICTTLLPIAPLNALQFPRRQKMILMVVFALGGMTCVISILRLPSLYNISQSKDVSWDNPSAAIWSSMELYGGIICSCLPTLKGLVSRIFPLLSFGDSYYQTRSGERLGSLGPNPHNTFASSSCDRTLRESAYGIEKADNPESGQNLELRKCPSTLNKDKRPSSTVRPVSNAWDDEDIF